MIKQGINPKTSVLNQIQKEDAKSADKNGFKDLFTNQLKSKVDQNVKIEINFINKAQESEKIEKIQKIVKKDKNLSRNIL